MLQYDLISAPLTGVEQARSVVAFIISKKRFFLSQLAS